MPQAEQNQRTHVLLIDDDMFILAALRRLLNSEHDVTAVASAPDALALIESGKRFDLILCDLRMPGMTGMEFYEKLHETTPEMSRRVIFCTGATFSPEVRQFFDRIPNRILEKPFDPAGVRSFVRACVKEFDG